MMVKKQARQQQQRQQPQQQTSQQQRQNMYYRLQQQKLMQQQSNVRQQQSIQPQRPIPLQQQLQQPNILQQQQQQNVLKQVPPQQQGLVQQPQQTMQQQQANLLQQSQQQLHQQSRSQEQIHALQHQQQSDLLQNQQTNALQQQQTYLQQPELMSQQHTAQALQQQQLLGQNNGQQRPQQQLLQQAKQQQPLGLQQLQQQAGKMNQQQNLLEQQKQQQRAVDYQEIVWSKLQVLKDKYLHAMNDLFKMLVTRSRQPMRAALLQRWKYYYKGILSRVIRMLTASRTNLPKDFNQDKLEALEEQLAGFMVTYKKIQQQQQQQQQQHVQQTSCQIYQSSVATPVIGTPGISASPFLEFSPSPAQVVCAQDAAAPDTPFGETASLGDAYERLLKIVGSMSLNALSSAVREMKSVISLSDMLAASAPGLGCRAAVGEDLAASTKCRLQAKALVSNEGGAMKKLNKRYLDSIALSVISSDGSVANSLHKLISRHQN